MLPSLRRGLTLLEMVVVLAIVGVALALLLPALQKARNRAARVSCAAHLKDIGLGFLTHHDAKGLFPQGGDSGPDGGLARPDERPEWSWAYQLLPFVGREDLHRGAVDAVDRTPVAPFYCPTRRAPVAETACLDYAGNAGSQGDGLNGTVVRGARPLIGLADLVDGAATTLLAADREINPAFLGTGMGDRAPYNRAGWNAAAQAYRLGLEPPVRDRRDDADAPTLRFGSSHRHGINALFADGSVRHIGYGIEPTAWLRACVRDDLGPMPID